MTVGVSTAVAGQAAEPWSSSAGQHNSWKTLNEALDKGAKILIDEITSVQSLEKNRRPYSS